MEGTEGQMNMQNGQRVLILLPSDSTNHPQMLGGVQEKQKVGDREERGTIWKQTEDEAYTMKTRTGFRLTLHTRPL